MANAVLSNRERKELRKVTPKAPRVPRGEAVVRVAPPTPKEPDATERDGLVWLGRKGRLTPEQLRVGKWWSDRARDAGDISLRSCLDVTEGHGSSTGGGLPPAALASKSTAKRELFVAKWVVLRGEPDMLLVMEGVCEKRQTLRFLAGGNQQRARDLEAILKCALNQLSAWLKEPKEPA